MRKTLHRRTRRSPRSLVGAPPPPPPTGRPPPPPPSIPGVMTDTDGAQCTANFVYTDAAGAVYIGQAAHCSGTGGQTDTDGCTTQSLPLGTPVEVTGASQARHARLQLVDRDAGRPARPTPTPAPTTTSALIKLDPADYGKVNPSVPTLGGPTALGDDDRAGRHRLLVRQLLAAPGRHAALAEDRQEPRRLRRRLDAPRLHRLARHPRRLGLGLHGRRGQRVRRPRARSSSPRSSPPTASPTCARCSPTCAPTAART